MRRPHFIAEQARNASGIIGRIIAAIMARETRGDNLWAIEALAPKPGERVLDLGTGHGRAIPEIARRVGANGFVEGVDPSPLMVQIASAHNVDLVASGRAEFWCASAERLPFENGFFDKAMAVHVLYFWPELELPLAELARVLRPGGALVLLFRTSDDPSAQAFPQNVYAFRTLEEVATVPERAGFDSVRTMPDRPDATHVVVTGRRGQPIAKR